MDFVDTFAPALVIIHTIYSGTPDKNNYQASEKQ